MIEKLKCGCDFSIKYDYFWCDQPIEIIEELDEEAYKFLCDATENDAIWWKKTGLYIVTKHKYCDSVTCPAGLRHFFVVIDKHKRLYNPTVCSKEMLDNLSFVRRDRERNMWNRLEDMLNGIS